MVLFTDLLQHLQMLFIFTKRLKVSMICGSQNMNSIMRYDITFVVLVLCKLQYCLIINLLRAVCRMHVHVTMFASVCTNITTDIPTLTPPA